MVFLLIDADCINLEDAGAVGKAQMPQGVDKILLGVDGDGVTLHCPLPRLFPPDIRQRLVFSSLIQRDNLKVCLDRGFSLTARLEVEQPYVGV